MAADTTGKKISLTSRNVAFLVLGREMYTEYLNFQRTIILPSSSSVYQSPEKWIAARNAIQFVARGGLPQIRAYRELMFWLHETGKLHTVHDSPDTTLAIAKRCGHVLHPAIASEALKNTACPMCTITQSTAILSRAWGTWKMLGAPDRRSPFVQGQLSAEFYCGVKHIWRFERKRWLNLVRHYQELDEQVAAWEAEAGKTDASSICKMEERRRTNSVKEALRYARENDPHRVETAELPFVPRPALNHRARFRSNQMKPNAEENLQKSLKKQTMASQLSPVSEPPSPPPSPSFSRLARSKSEPTRHKPFWHSSRAFSTPLGPVRANKAVKFAADIVEHKKRNGFTFKRTSMAYVAGRHASPSKAGWADTSFMTQSNFRYDNESSISTLSDVWADGSDLELELQAFEAMFREYEVIPNTRVDKYKRDTDSTVDDDPEGDTESDTSSESDSDSDSDTEEDDDFQDPLAEAILQSIEMQTGSLDDTGDLPEAGRESGESNAVYLSGSNLRTLDSLGRLPDAGLKSLLSTSSLHQVPEVSDQDAQERDIAGPSIETGLVQGVRDDEATTEFEPMEGCEISEDPAHLSEMASSLKDTPDSDSKVTEAVVGMANCEGEVLPFPE